VKQYIRTGQEPGKDQDGYQEWLGWFYFEDHIEGLPDDWRFHFRLKEKRRCSQNEHARHERATIH